MIYYVEFLKSNVQNIIDKLIEKKYTKFQLRIINNIEYCAMPQNLVFKENNLKYFSKFFLFVPNQCFICGIKANYNYRNLKSGIYCNLHRLNNMYDIKKKFCEKKKCNVRATFGFEKPLFCAKHKEAGMNNLVSTKCNTEGCNTIPIYGYNKRIKCAKHKEEGMIDLKNKICEIDKCKTLASYGYEVRKPLRCREHKEVEMEDVKTKKCEFNGCKIVASYGFTKSVRCFNHKEEGMENKKSKKCEIEGCKIISLFGYEGQKAIRCKKHMKEGMENLKDKKCSSNGCKIRPTFGIKGSIDLRCKKHKTEEMTDIKNKKCFTYLCDTQSRKKYDGYCARCFVFLFPEKPNARFYKTREITVVDFIKEKFKDLKWIYDKSVGASNKRPDLLCDLEEQIIIIEIDENQHLHYFQRKGDEYCLCENKRIMQISQDLNFKPIIFIRFNPDSYIINGKKEKSCWKYNNSGISVVFNKQKWQDRLDLLAETVEYWKKNKTDKTIEEIFLFYNNDY